MIHDLDETDAAELGPYDLCIVGTGPAGGTLAAELTGKGLRVCVLESGRLRPTPRGDRLRATKSEGIHVKDWSRERVLGGASSTWAGLSSPLDRADVEPRACLGGAGWPIPHGELLELYEEAAERYRFPRAADFSPGGFGALRPRGELHPEWRDLEEKVFLAAGEPQHFGRELARVWEAPDVDLWLDATVLRLVCASGTRRVEAALARSRGGREVRVRARGFALATGGIENARLLLLSRDLCPAGLGNERDQVGRRLMNHPKSYCGVLHLARPVEELPYYFGCLYKGWAGYAGLRFREAEQARRGLLNSYVRLEPLFPWSDSTGIEALVLLAKRSKVVVRRLAKGSSEEVVDLRDYSETGDDSELQNERKRAVDWLLLPLRILLDLPRVSRYLFFRLTRAKPLVRRARLRNFMEMEPSPENRVTLADELDEHGQPLPLVRHDSTELDRRSLVELHAALARELEDAGVGRLDSPLAASDPWPVDQDASHHMGTTRMGADPASSVVDPHLRVHGVDNLWMAGASVFPTSGCANPTFTIVALSIRLARRLREELAPAGGGAAREARR